MSIPTLADVTAAWHALPAETRDRIGICAVDYVFQGFVHGDLYVAIGQPEDRAVFDDAIREAAAEAENRRLNELNTIIETALPDLFGPAGENPAWSENAGPAPTAAARAMVLAAAKAGLERQQRERSLRARLGRKGLRMHPQRSGYVIFDRDSRMSKTDILDLDGAEAWLAEQGRTDG